MIESLAHKFLEIKTDQPTNPLCPLCPSPHLIISSSYTLHYRRVSLDLTWLLNISLVSLICPLSLFRPQIRSIPSSKSDHCEWNSKNQIKLQGSMLEYPSVILECDDIGTHDSLNSVRSKS